MDSISRNQAVVIVGHSVNVGLVHHELLRRLGVIPDEWGAPVTPAVATPEASVIAYRNGASLLAQPGRIQVSAAMDERSDVASEVADVATKLLRAMPSGGLSAVGVNAIIFVPAGDPGERLAARFLREDAVPEAVGKPTGFGCSLSVDAPGARLTLAFQPVDQPAPGIQANANYHTVVDSVEDACAAVSRFDERMEALPGVLSALLGM
jgi:hypothetical protein